MDFFKLGLRNILGITLPGAVLVLVGVAMVTGNLNAAGTWLLQSFPVFQRLTL